MLDVLFLLFIFIKSDYVAIDLGTQFIKSVTYQKGFQIINHENSHNKLLTPSAVAFKTPNKTIKEPLNYTKAAQSTLLVGDSAVRYLKQNPDSGTLFVPRFVGRNSTVHTKVPLITNPAYMLTFLFQDVIQTVENFEAMVVTIPTYYTYSQRKSIIDSIWTAKASFLGLIDDSQSLTYYYSSKFPERYRQEAHPVTFVDIGATSCKAYRVVFDLNIDEKTTNSNSEEYFSPYESIETNNNKKNNRENNRENNGENDEENDESYEIFGNPIANMTSYEFSENCGGEIFAKKISKKLNISINKARKRLMNGEDFREILSEEMIILQNIVSSAMNGDCNEVQLLGGGSRSPFIVETIREAAGEAEVRKELSIQQSLATGAMLWLQEYLNLTKKMPNMTKISPYNSYVQCNNQTSSYCNHNGFCNDSILLEDNICDQIIIKMFDKPPDGCNDVLTVFDLKNISDFKKILKGKSKYATGFIMLQPPVPVVTAALWCRNSDMKCETIKVDQAETPLNEIMQSEAFVKAVMLGKEEQEKKIKIKAKLIDLIDVLSNRCDDPLIEEAEKLIADNSASTLDLLVMVQTLEIRLKYQY